MKFKNKLSAVLLTSLSIIVVPAHADTTSLAKLFSTGQSVACTYEKTDENGKQAGTIYVANKKMRGQIEVSSSEGTYPMNILKTGDWQYMWGGPLGETQGMKMPVSAASSHQSPHAKHGPDINEDMNYQCKPWPADESKFVPPSNVQFMEMGNMMPAAAVMAQGEVPANGAGMNMHTMQCSACEQAPEEAREQCRQALGC